MERGGATNHADLLQHTTLHYTEDLKPLDARSEDLGSGPPNIPCSSFRVPSA